ncbi:hypothetical protein HK405_005246, partial [Cladochytrium tenue]
LVYDVTNPDSFKNITRWLLDFIVQADVSDPYSFPFILVGNKTDLAEDVRVTDEQISQLASEIKRVCFDRCRELYPDLASRLETETAVTANSSRSSSSTQAEWRLSSHNEPLLHLTPLSEPATVSLESNLLGSADSSMDLDTALEPQPEQPPVSEDVDAEKERKDSESPPSMAEAGRSRSGRIFGTTAVALDSSPTIEPASVANPAWGPLPIPSTTHLLRSHRQDPVRFAYLPMRVGSSSSDDDVVGNAVIDDVLGDDATPTLLQSFDPSTQLIPRESPAGGMTPPATPPKTSEGSYPSVAETPRPEAINIKALVDNVISPVTDSERPALLVRSSESSPALGYGDDLDIGSMPNTDSVGVSSPIMGVTGGDFTSLRSPSSGGPLSEQDVTDSESGIFDLSSPGLVEAKSSKSVSHRSQNTSLHTTDAPPTTSAPTDMQSFYTGRDTQPTELEAPIDAAATPDTPWHNGDHRSLRSLRTFGSNLSSYTTASEYSMAASSVVGIGLGVGAGEVEEPLPMGRASLERTPRLASQRPRPGLRNSVSSVASSLSSEVAAAELAEARRRRLARVRDSSHRGTVRASAGRHSTSNGSVAASEASSSSSSSADERELDSSASERADSSSDADIEDEREELPADLLAITARDAAAVFERPGFADASSPIVAAPAPPTLLQEEWSPASSSRTVRAGRRRRGGGGGDGPVVGSASGGSELLKASLSNSTLRALQAASLAASLAASRHLQPADASATDDAAEPGEQWNSRATPTPTPDRARATPTPPPSLTAMTATAAASPALPRAAPPPPPPAETLHLLGSVPHFEVSAKAGGDPVDAVFRCVAGLLVDAAKTAPVTLVAAASAQDAT